MRKIYLPMILATFLLVSGCASKAKPAASPAAEVAERASRGDAQVASKVEEAVEATQAGRLTISKQVQDLCPGVRAPRFGYDSAELRQEWAEALRQVADCMKHGGLSNHGILLTGHTDPRGDEDYNMALGGRRASAVKGVFLAFGVEGNRVKTTSRGKADARGTDEPSWAEDRRVEIDLDPSGVN